MGLLRGTSAVVAGLVLALLHAGPAGAEDTAEEIHYSYGDDAGSVVVSWRGADSAIAYGLTEAYGFQAVAMDSAITPVDSAGPFREVTLTGLAPDTAYHYRIGAGVDHVLRTAPIGSFRWVDVGDTASSACKPWVAQTHQLIAQLQPRFVTHGGDISEANVCGVPAVHTYYTDQQAWSTAAAFQPVWGNHEYGNPQPGAPAGTPRDSLANYKGRGRLTHPQSVPTDTVTQVKAPGCGITVNTCMGEDWGWFRAGGVLFISYPEIWVGALAAWQPVADALMAEAAQDPTINFVMTYGHRPAYSSLTVNGWDPGIRSAVDALAVKYSAGGGKYVLNLAHHVHALEVFGPINGLTHVTNATGGQGSVALPSPPAAGSLVRFSHLGVLAGDYDAAARQLSLRWVCGPTIPDVNKQDPCGYGDTIWSTTFTAGCEPVAGAASGPAVTPACPAPGGTGGPSPSPSPTSTGGPTPTVSPGPTTTDSPAPTRPTDPAPGGTPTPSTSPTRVPREWVVNSGLEADLSGWAGRYGANADVAVSRVTSGARTGKGAVKVNAAGKAKDLTSGFNDDPRWVRATVAGTAYAASAWMKPKIVGQELVVRLREWSSTGTLLTDRTGAVTASSTGWVKVSAQLTATKSGGSLSMAVYAKDLDAGEWFLADDLSLTGR
ncbi:fibronectin type III domain-containing protein [Actinoplanes sp. NPDC051633]|uniref:fibronectin type III domain-containing protein n=1 Tax=Actinoplanes sp. NPDC051633 TaxID=3155670 RepID=UPI003426D003